MPYLNLDDEFTEHPKVDKLSDGAFRLHVSGLRYCAKNLTDGAVPGARVDRLKPRFKAAELRELIRCNVWHEGGEGCDSLTCIKGESDEFVIHDYLQWMAETGECMTGAAERLGISRPALIRWCQRHAAEVGLQLLERDPRDPNYRSRCPGGLYGEAS